MLVPSTRFDCGDAHLRFGYGRRDFPEGLAQLEAYLKAARPRAPPGAAPARRR